MYAVMNIYIFSISIVKCNFLSYWFKLPSFSVGLLLKLLQHAQNAVSFMKIRTMQKNAFCAICGLHYTLHMRKVPNNLLRHKHDASLQMVDRQ